MIENNFVASLRSDGAFGVALVSKPEGQYCICPLSHEGASHVVSPMNRLTARNVDLSWSRQGRFLQHCLVLSQRALVGVTMEMSSCRAFVCV